MTFKQLIKSTDALRTGAYTQDRHVHAVDDDTVIFAGSGGRTPLPAHRALPAGRDHLSA